MVGFGVVRSPNVYRIRLPLFERSSFFIAFSLPILIGTLVDNSKFFSTSPSFSVDCGENRNDGDGDDDDASAATADVDGLKSNFLFSEPDGKRYKS